MKHHQIAKDRDQIKIELNEEQTAHGELAEPDPVLKEAEPALDNIARRR